MNRVWEFQQMSKIHIFVMHDGIRDIEDNKPVNYTISTYPSTPQLRNSVREFFFNLIFK